MFTHLLTSRAYTFATRPTGCKELFMLLVVYVVLTHAPYTRSHSRTEEVEQRAARRPGSVRERMTRSRLHGIRECARAVRNTTLGCWRLLLMAVAAAAAAATVDWRRTDSARRITE